MRDGWTTRRPVAAFGQRFWPSPWQSSLALADCTTVLQATAFTAQLHKLAKLLWPALPCASFIATAIVIVWALCSAPLKSRLHHDHNSDVPHLDLLVAVLTSHCCFHISVTISSRGERSPLPHLVRGKHEGSHYGGRRHDRCGTLRG